MIETAGLKKTFIEASVVRFWERRKICALDGVDMSVAGGEVVVLLGRNGAGKTTLLKILATLVLPTAGAARVGDVDVTDDPTGARRLIGLMTGDERGFYWRLTGRANLELFAALNNMQRRDAAARTGEVLALTGLADRADTSFKTYSTGMRQRLALARCLLHNPPVLLLDEPAKGLDPVMKSGFLNLLRGTLAGRQGKTILFTTHNIEETEVADRIIVLNAGRVIASLPASESREAKAILIQAEKQG